MNTNAKAEDLPGMFAKAPQQGKPKAYSEFTRTFDKQHNKTGPRM